jgi:hypothetical protein
MDSLNYIQSVSEDFYNSIAEKKLWFVRSLDIYNPQTVDNLANHSIERYFNLEHVLNPNMIFEIPERLGFNQAINNLVLPFTGTNIWDCRPYVFVAPMSEFVGELYGGTQQDYLTIGAGHTYTEESFLLVPESEVEKIKASFPGLRATVVGYKYPKDALYGKEGVSCFNALHELKSLNGTIETSRLAVNKLLKSVGAWTLPEELQYLSHAVHNIPVTLASNSTKSEYSIRYNMTKGDKHNVNVMLSTYSDLSMADNTPLETITKYVKYFKTNYLNKYNKDAILLIDIGNKIECISDIYPMNFTRLNFAANSILNDPNFLSKYNQTVQNFLTIVINKIINIPYMIEILYTIIKSVDQPLKDKLINAMLKRDEWLQIALLNTMQAHPELKRAGDILIKHFHMKCIEWEDDDEEAKYPEITTNYDNALMNAIKTFVSLLPRTGGKSRRRRRVRRQTKRKCH